MARVVITNPALDDIQHIAAFIASDAPFRASIVVEGLIRSIERLEDFPLSGRIIPERADPSYRELIFRSYRVMYRVTDSLVEILHVYHSARNFDSSTLN